MGLVDIDEVVLVEGKDPLQLLFFGGDRLLELDGHIGEVMALGDVRETRTYLVILQGFILWGGLAPSLTSLIASTLLWKVLLRSG